MQENIKRARDPEQIGYSSIDQTSTMNGSQNADESQQTLGIPSLEPRFPACWEARLLALLAVIIFLATFVLLTLAALGTQNLFLLSTIPIMARELAYMFRRAVDFLLLPGNSIPATSKTPHSSVK
jgi:hypothetical protein